MGEHRASITIKFSMHGIEAGQEWWINWSPDDTGVDRRVVEWIAEQAKRAMDKWDEEQWEADHLAREKAEEETERAELKRLQAKYGDTPTTPPTPAPR